MHAHTPGTRFIYPSSSNPGLLSFFKSPLVLKDTGSEMLPCSANQLLLAQVQLIPPPAATLPMQQAPCVTHIANSMCQEARAPRPLGPLMHSTLAFITTTPCRSPKCRRTCATCRCPPAQSSSSGRNAQSAPGAPAPHTDRTTAGGSRQAARVCAGAQARRTKLPP